MNECTDNFPISSQRSISMHANVAVARHKSLNKHDLPGTKLRGQMLHCHLRPWQPKGGYLPGRL